MTSYADTTKLPAAQARSVLRDAARARETARQEIRDQFRDERRAQAMAEAQAAQQRVAEAGGIRSLPADAYRAEKAAMLARLRRGR